MAIFKWMNVLLTREKGWEKKKAGYFSPIHKATVNMVEHYVVSMVSPIWNVAQDEPIAVIYLDLDFDKLRNQWYTSAKMNQSFSFMIYLKNRCCLILRKIRKKRIIKDS